MKAGIQKADWLAYPGDAWVAAAEVVSPVVHPVLLGCGAVLA